MYIFDLIPDPQVLLALAPEEVAHGLLRVAASNLQNGIVHRDEIARITRPHDNAHPYRPAAIENEVELAVSESLIWLEANALLVPAQGTNGRNGFRVIGRRGRDLINKTKFDNFRRAAEFPKSLLHPLIADKVWTALARGDL